MVIYYNDKPVHISNNSSEWVVRDGGLLMQADKQNICSALDLLKEELPSLYLYGRSESEVLSVIRDNVRTIHAAGGVVRKDDGDFLVILRHGKWDLPKGKLEEGESPEEGARREIEEECGVKVKITDHLKTTFHFYDHKGERILKETSWFRALLISDEGMMPQAEEDITEVKWVSKDQLPEILSNTYSNIRDVLEAYFNSSSGN